MKKIIFAALLFFAFSLVHAATAAQERLLAYDQHLKMKEGSLFKTLSWRSIGPYFMSGRLVDIEAYENDPFTFYIAAASGGLWKTTNNGTSWTPLFDNQSAITIGDIAISQTDANLIWVGTGEANSSRSAYAGTGVFKSTDGGKTWQHMGLADSQHIARILIDPRDNNTVYVASEGHLYTDNEERGLFKTTDGGKTWEKALYISPRTGVVDVAMHPRNNQILLAAAWQKERKAWNFVESGEESAIYRTADGGKTWTKAVSGFPQGKYVGRIGLAFARSNPDVVYAFLDNQEPKPQPKREGPSSGITAETLEKMSSEDFLKLDNAKLDLFFKENNAPAMLTAEMVKMAVKAGQLTLPVMAQMMKGGANAALFNTRIKGAEVYRSNDGGQTWARAHSDYLDNGIINTYGYYFGQIAVSPADENTVYILGVPAMKSTDGAKTFKEIPAVGGAYGRGVDEVHPDHHALWINPKNPKHLLLGNDGGLNISYDEGQTFQKVNNIPLAQCYTIACDMQEPYNLYSGLQDNGVNMGPSTFQYGDVENVWKMIAGGDGAFVQPQPDDPTIVYAASQFGNVSRLNLKNRRLSKSLTPQPPDPRKGAYRLNWQSPFMLSRHDPYVLYMGANKMLRLVTPTDKWEEISPDLTNGKNTDGDVPYATITAIDESPLTAGLLYAGTDDGNVWVRQAAGKDWQKINAGLPPKWATRIVASKYKKERVYVTLTGYREDDFTTYVFASEDMGKTWKPLKANLPDEPVNVIREDPLNENVLYLGTDLTVYVSLDRGLSWNSLKNNLPTNAVYDLTIQPRENELAIATHGRGIFILPVETIQKLTPDILKRALYVFKARPGKRSTNRYYPQQNVGLDLYLKEPGDLKIDITGKDGKIVRQLTVKGQKGLNTVEWDLKGTDGKTVAADDYSLTLKAGKASEKVAVEVH